MTNQTFANAIAVHVSNLANAIEGISEDRRPWLRKKLANSLLFSAASAFHFYSTRPTKNEQSLNEAIALREAAMPFYEDDDKRFEADCESICRFYEPKAPIAVSRKKGAPKVPKLVALREAELLARAKARFDMNTRILPSLKGFLNGAKYEPIDLENSELGVANAHITATRAANALAERIEQDILHCSGKWQEATDDCDDVQRTKWETELFLLEEDEKFIKNVIKQHGYEAE